MPMIRHETTTSVLRFYEQASDLATPPFDAICTVLWETPRTVWLKGFHGQLSRGLLRALLEWLIDNHIQTVKAHRDSAHGLPFARPQPDGSVLIDVADLSDRFGRRTESTWGDL